MTGDLFDVDWVTFPGGELEGQAPRRVRAECPACRDAAASGGPRPRLCFACYRAELVRQRAMGEVLSRVVSPFNVDAGSAAPRGVVRHFHVPPTPGEADPRYAALARRRRRAQLAARRALAEPVVDLEQFPVSWRPFVRIAMNA